MRSAVRLLGPAVLAAAATLTISAPVQAAPTAALGQCTTTRGTIVAADFGHWGGPVVGGCGVGSSSGYVLLHDGGFSTAGTRRDGPAFICRLGSSSFRGGTPYPTADEDACNTTPPQSAYWSLWLAPTGATSWQHSDYGATSDHPVDGEVELWTFGGTSGSGVPANRLINQLRAHNTAPTGGSAATTKATVRPTPPRPPAHAGAPGTTTGGPAGREPAAGFVSGASGGPTAASSRGTSATAAAPSTSPAATSPTAGASPASSSRAIVAAQPTSTSAHGSGSVLPLVFTAIILAVLGGLGGLSLLRRRRATGD